MAYKKNFYSVVQEAVNDIADNGFDSEDRLARWTKKIRYAAEQTLPSELQLEKMLRDSLISIYRKLVDKGEVAAVHSGVTKFTIEKLRPQLRVELDKRIMASSALIKLNRKQAIDKTLARFAGWTTSVPAGGTSQANKAKTKGDIKKAMQSLPFIERRLLIDQGHKLIFSIDEIIAEDGGAIAGKWASNFMQANYDYREEHAERDGKIYLIRNSRAHKKGLVKPGPDGYTDQITKPAEEINCRCRYRYLYNLRSLPVEMLTAKGKAALAEARAALAS